ncbi:aminotransferase class V-fold PLP-dependent enzyme [Telmatocola sphagniphila]|uniref:Aminotransferase class V-fold PLP-dependent enzyme n=2 Tax=Telmatocola sphagniphila TaxID=1123043 RepID=A0A8E6B6L2_9BACT|nr:aminotransferase class V-fold PLP-dependent enzyme [Telmatocola sphagniphila]QVL32833.1 aminotransferase class V-fold PLP-dependent enzyme [Telmatocola sphagniphila]
MDWKYHRSRMMLDPDIINLNTGSFGPQPIPVYEAAVRFRQMLAAEPTHFYVRQAPPLLWEARRETAKFLGTTPEKLVFTNNVSSSINFVASGLTISSPGEILLTDHEYGAMHWCWERAAKRLGLTLRTFPLPTMPEDPQEIVDAACAAMTARTRVFFFSHVLSPTGLVLPAKELCTEARKRGILTVVDGAHAPAMIPLNVDDIRADFYAANLHKWLLAPCGAGFLAIGSGNEDRLQPLEVSWGYHYPRTDLDAPDEFGSTRRIRHLEFNGTRDICPWLACPEAIRFQTEIGWQAIRSKIEELSNYVRRRMRETVALKPATPADRRSCGSLTAFNLPEGIHPVKLREAIWKHRIEIPIVERPDRLIIRFSTHFYNTEDEIEALLKILPGALQEAKA